MYVIECVTFCLAEALKIRGHHVSFMLVNNVGLNWLVKQHENNRIMVSCPAGIIITRG